MNWAEIKIRHNQFFKENPVSELVLADVFESKYHKRSKSSLYYFFGLCYLCLRGLFSYLKFKRSKPFFVKGIISTSSDRANNWGIKYPLVKYFNDNGIRLLFVVSSDIYQNRRQELGSLNNTVVIQSKSFNASLKKKIYYSDLMQLTNSIIPAYRIVRTEKIGTLVHYCFMYLKLLTKARAMKAVLKDTDFSLTLGVRLFGVLHQVSNIKHVMIQHGHMTKESVIAWPNYTSANCFAAILFGKHYKTAISQVYPDTNFIARGNPYYDTIQVKQNSSVRNIVFFSSTHGFVKGVSSRTRNVDETKKQMVYDTLQELLELHKLFKSSHKVKVKLHPNENANAYLAFDPLFGREIEIISGKVDSFEVLKSAQIAISWFSTANLEAVIANVFSVQLLKFPNFGLQEYSYGIDNLQKLHPLLLSPDRIDELKAGQADVVNKSYIANIGYATKTICDYIINETFSG